MPNTTEPHSKAVSTTSSSSATDANPDSDGNPTPSSHTGAIAGGTIGAVGMVMVIAGLFLRRRRVRSRGGITHGTQELHQNYEFDIDIDCPPGTAPSMPNAPSAGVVTSDARATQSFKNSTPSMISPPQIQAPESHAPPYDNLRSSVPESNAPNPAPQYAVPSRFDSDLRHTDAGVLIPLSRSSSGRLPPAYLSWEGDVSVESESPMPQRLEGSASLPGASVVENATAFRLEGKGE